MRGAVLVVAIASCTPSPAPPATVAAASVSSATVATSATPTTSAPDLPVVGSGAPAATGSTSPPPDAARDKRIRDKFGRVCRLERTCGALWGIDCEAATDGPYYYVKAETLETVSECGGFCRGGRCTSCPPKTWACATY